MIRMFLLLSCYFVKDKELKKLLKRLILSSVYKKYKWFIFTQIFRSDKSDIEIIKIATKRALCDLKQEKMYV